MGDTLFWALVGGVTLASVLFDLVGPHNGN